MTNETKIFGEIDNERQERIIWPAGEAVNLNGSESEQAEAARQLAGINPSAMEDALQAAVKDSNGLFPPSEELKPERDLMGLAEELQAEQAADNATERLIFQREIMTAAESLPEDDGASEEVPITETVTLPKAKVDLMKKLIVNIKENSRRLEELLSGGFTEDGGGAATIAEFAVPLAESENSAENEKIVEGVFNGEHMIGPDGKQYNVPPNYASKSKLVEGDILKLTVTPAGKFIYKQIGPIERERIIGNLVCAKNGDYCVEQGKKRWRILTASVTYFKGHSDDEAVILVPKYGESNWAAVENIIARNV